MLTPEEALESLQASNKKLPKHANITDLIEAIYPRSHEPPSHSISVMYAPSEYAHMLMSHGTDVGDFCIRIDTGKAYLRVKKTGDFKTDWCVVTNKIESMSKFPYFFDNLSNIRTKNPLTE